MWGQVLPAMRRTSDLMAIGRRIRKLRRQQRQDALASLLGVTTDKLSKIERGKIAPSLDVLLRLREEFGKPVDWILTGQE